MAPGVAEPSFAERHMAKFGWKKGMGLGKSNDGITEPIKLKLRLDRQGMGQDPKQKYENWWDNVYNNIVDNITIERKQDGTVQLNRSKDSAISKDRPNLMKSGLLYNNFKQHGTLIGSKYDGESNTITSSEKKRAKKISSNVNTEDNSTLSSDSSSDSSSDDEAPERKRSNGVLLDYTDEQLLKLCGGRTAHKGARHGIRMTGKLARLEKMEKNDASLIAKWQDQKLKEKPSEDHINSISVLEIANEADHVEVQKEINAKYKCKIMFNYGEDEQNQSEDTSNGDAQDRGEASNFNTADPSFEELTKKKKKKSKSVSNLQVECEDTSSNIVQDLELASKKKKKKSKKSIVEVDHNGDGINMNEDANLKLSSKKKKNITKTYIHIDCIDNGVNVNENDTSMLVPKKKKKKSKTNCEDESTISESLDADGQPATEELSVQNNPKKKKVREVDNTEEQNFAEQIKHKKKKKDKNTIANSDVCQSLNDETILCQEFDKENSEVCFDKCEGDAVVGKKKKSKKRKREADGDN